MAEQTIVESERERETSSDLAHVVGWTAVVFSGLYFISDLIELTQGGFSTPQLILTLMAEAAIPFFVIGFYVLQRPRIGLLGRATAILYAYTFAFFTGTVVFALAESLPDWDALVDRLGLWITLHGIFMVVAGLAFGLAVLRAGVFPRWTAVALMAGVVLIAASSGLPDAAQIAAAGVRDLAFAGMGASVLLTRSKPKLMARVAPTAVGDVRTRSAS
jgi:hypothetical protein